MDIIEKKFPEQKYLPFVNLLKWFRSPLALLGTGGNLSQLYPSDIDLFSKIGGDWTGESALINTIKIIEKTMERDDMFFIEGKVQDKDGGKWKWKTLDELKANDFQFYKYFGDNIDYVKFDYVLFVEGQFVELSVIYVFNKDPLDYDVLKMSLSNDMIDLIHEGKYYKSLKRLFAILKLEDPPARNNLVKISELFNSATGALYKRNSILKAIELYLETYNDEEAEKVAMRVYNNLGFLNIDEMPEIIKAYDSIINREGKKFIKDTYPQLLQIKDLKGKPIMVEGGRRVYRSAIVHNDLVADA